MNSSKSKLLTYVVIAIVVALALYFYFGKSTSRRTPKIETTEKALEVLSETPPVIVETNPVKKVPDLNPVEKTNPFKISNPFE